MSVLRWLALALLLVPLVPLAVESGGTPIAVAVSHPNGDTLELYEDKGQCSAGARALYTIGQGSPVPHARGERIEGCWLLYGGQIWALFVDGDRRRLSPNIFEWAHGKRPGAPIKLL